MRKVFEQTMPHLPGRGLTAIAVEDAPDDTSPRHCQIIGSKGELVRVAQRSQVRATIWTPISSRQGLECLCCGAPVLSDRLHHRAELQRLGPYS